MKLLNYKKSFAVLAAIFCTLTTPITIMADNVLPNTHYEGRLCLLGTIWDDADSRCLGSIDGKTYFYKPSEEGDQKNGFGYYDYENTCWNISQTPADTIKGLDKIVENLIRITLYDDWRPDPKTPTNSTNTLITLASEGTLSFYKIIRTIPDDCGAYPTYKLECDKNGAPKIQGQTKELTYVNNIDVIKLQDYLVKGEKDKTWKPTLISYVNNTQTDKKSNPDGAREIYFGYLTSNDTKIEYIIDKQHIEECDNASASNDSNYDLFQKRNFRPGGFVLCNKDRELSYVLYDLHCKYGRPDSVRKYTVDAAYCAYSYLLTWNTDNPKSNFLTFKQTYGEPLRNWKVGVDTDNLAPVKGNDEFGPVVPKSLYGLEFDFDTPDKLICNFIPEFFSGTWSITKERDGVICGTVSLEPEPESKSYQMPPTYNELTDEQKIIYETAWDNNGQINILVWGLPLTYTPNEGTATAGIEFTKSDVTTRAFSKTQTFDASVSVGAGCVWGQGWSSCISTFSHGYSNSEIDENEQDYTTTVDQQFIQEDGQDKSDFYNSSIILGNSNPIKLDKTVFLTDTNTNNTDDDIALKLDGFTSDNYIIAIKTPKFTTDKFGSQTIANKFKNDNINSNFSPYTYNIAPRLTSNLYNIDSENIEAAAKKYKEWQEQYKEDFDVLFQEDEDREKIGITPLGLNSNNPANVQNKEGDINYGYPCNTSTTGYITVDLTNCKSHTNQNSHSIGYSKSFHQQAAVAGAAINFDDSFNWSTAYSTSYGTEESKTWTINHQGSANEVSLNYHYSVNMIDVGKFRANSTKPVDNDTKQLRRPIWIPEWAWYRNQSFILMMPYISPKDTTNNSQAKAEKSFAKLKDIITKPVSKK